MKTPETLFLAWQDSISRYWFSIGRLTFNGGIYQFAYTQGVKEAEEKCAFKPLSWFPRLCKMSVDVYDDFRPFSGSQYQPLIAEIATAIKST